MARTAIPLSVLTKDNGISGPAGTAVDPTNGHVIAALGRPILILLHNTAGATKVVTVRAGVNPPAYRKDIGDLTYTAQASGDSYIGPFVSARFVQAAGGADGGSGGSIFVDLASGVTGTITAFQLPDFI